MFTMNSKQEYTKSMNISRLQCCFTACLSLLYTLSSSLHYVLVQLCSLLYTLSQCSVTLFLSADLHSVLVLLNTLSTAIHSLLVQLYTLPQFCFRVYLTLLYTLSQYLSSLCLNTTLHSQYFTLSLSTALQSIQVQYGTRRTVCFVLQ